MVTVRRTRDAGAVHALVGKSYPRTMGRGSIDRVLARDSVDCVASDHGGLLFMPGDAPGEYKMTLFIAPAGRGKWGREFVEAAISWMFENTAAERLIGLSLGLAAEAIRLTYQPAWGRMERIADQPQATIRWTFDKSAWKAKRNAAPAH
jgi:hypothetical protein